MSVLDAVMFEFVGHDFLVKLGVVSATGNCTHIHHQVDAVNVEQEHELFKRACGMSDGEHRQLSSSQTANPPQEEVLGVCI